MRRLFAISLVPLLLLCSKQDTQNTLATVGKSSIDRASYDAFLKVRKYYPTDLYQYFPGYRSVISYLVETEAIFQNAKQDIPKNTIQNSNDWKWKKTFYAGQIFLMEYLSQNMGSSESEIKNYYTSHKELFKKAVTDSTQKDSVSYRDLDEVRDTIVEILFLQKYPVDSAFASNSANMEKDKIDRNWFFNCKRNSNNFFMKAYYKEKFQKQYPDSINEIYGENKTITPSDMDVIISWIRPEYREQYKNSEGTRRLVEFLLQWKLFSEKAQQVGFTSTPSFKAIMDWAWKVEFTNEYMKNKVDPIINTSSYIDSSIIPYAIYDERGRVSSNLDSTILKDKIKSLYENQKYLKADSIVFQIRKSVGVQFLQNDLRDSKDQDPIALIKQADSLRDTGSIDEAEKIYSTLTKEFAFTNEGKQAFYELAKIQTEHQRYSAAINSYRNFLLSGVDEKKKSITFFMIGFIYDEYLDKSDLAETNYKWVLKNDPQCELADDAEFMMLHLGEPMNSVEELQAQTIRQNRKIETFEEGVTSQGDDLSSNK